jgi:hypothetical protein
MIEEQSLASPTIQWEIAIPCQSIQGERTSPNLRSIEAASPDDKSPDSHPRNTVNVETIHQMARFNRKEINLDTSPIFYQGSKRMAWIRWSVIIMNERPMNSWPLFSGRNCQRRSSTAKWSYQQAEFWLGRRKPQLAYLACKAYAMTRDLRLRLQDNLPMQESQSWRSVGNGS